MKTTDKKYNFGEKEYEYDSKQCEEVPVWQSPKYLESKKKAIEMIESEKYNLSTADFWILMNKTKTNKMAYTGLIISHNGCLKINDAIENKVIPNNFKVDKEGYKDSLIVSYVDDEVCEFGEVSTSNCKNEYPYAMAYKRCFDRVVLKKSKLAYAGIYSDSEAEEFREVPDETRNTEETTQTEITEEVAKEYTISFGKHKGRKLIELVEEKNGYIDYLLNKSKDEYLLKCIEVLTGQVLLTEDDQEEILDLINMMSELEMATNTSHDSILEHYGVESNKQMTLDQLRDCVANLEKKKAKLG